MRRYEIDGRRFSTLEGFFDEISRTLIPDAEGPQSRTVFDWLIDIVRVHRPGGRTGRFRG